MIRELQYAFVDIRLFWNVKHFVCSLLQISWLYLCIVYSGRHWTSDAFKNTRKEENVSFSPYGWTLSWFWWQVWRLQVQRVFRPGRATLLFTLQCCISYFHHCKNWCPAESGETRGTNLKPKCFKWRSKRGIVELANYHCAFAENVLSENIACSCSHKATRKVMLKLKFDWHFVVRTCQLVLYHPQCNNTRIIGIWPFQ